MTRKPQAYKVVLMDAAHLSQTFYLVCAEEGVGAFTTAAINAARIDEVLGIDGIEEGAVALCGCGWASSRPSGLEPRFQPYDPSAGRK